MIKRILCFFGLHTWNYYNEHPSSVDGSIICRHRECIKCGRIERMAYDFLESYWEKV